MLAGWVESVLRGVWSASCEDYKAASAPNSHNLFNQNFEALVTNQDKVGKIHLANSL